MAFCLFIAGFPYTKLSAGQDLVKTAFVAIVDSADTVDFDFDFDFENHMSCYPPGYLGDIG